MNINIAKLKEKSNFLLSITVKDQEKYKDERKLTFSILENIDTNAEVNQLEEVVNIFTKMIKLQTERENYISVMSNFLKILDEYKIKENNFNAMEMTNVFLIKDKTGKNYKFFLQENAKQYIKKHKNIFDNNTRIICTKNDNIDIENIIHSVLLHKKSDLAKLSLDSFGQTKVT